MRRFRSSSLSNVFLICLCQSSSWGSLAWQDTGELLRPILGTAFRDAQQSSVWTLEEHLSLHSEINAAALEALREFQGLQFLRVPSLPGPRGDIHSPAPTAWPLSVLPSSPVSLPFSHPHFSLKLIPQLPSGSVSTGTSGEVQPPTATKTGAEKPSLRQRRGIGPYFWKQSRLKFRWSCKHSWKHLLEAKAPKPSNSTRSMSWGGNNLEIENKLPDQLVFNQNFCCIHECSQGSHAVNNTSLSRTSKQAAHGTHTAITNNRCVSVLPKGLKNSSLNI